jgi:hypothetical protein
MKVSCTDAKIDILHGAYQLEYDRWIMRYNPKKRGSGWELVRNTSPGNDIIGEEYQEIVTFTRRECRDKTDAVAWLNTYRGRAAVSALLEQL